ncbi:hypothetical protein B0T14DRAFT_334205 [Immersiella caudata]|uniref:Uncharacterized protein n=1 Tax=Immersiella caudata TaxID=314043 RepID=A0AA39TLH8_9PEZI|nr:hypothetical protein B0T14DRAFT_334205 [Immersiella caudata]
MGDGAEEALLWGWQSAPDQRGTIDILWSCLATTFLCSWSCVCLNLPPPDSTPTQGLMQRIRWQLFTIFFPEVTVSLAAEQWESANQGVKKFRDLGYDDTFFNHKHAFFVDMGGILLQSPAFPAFPIDSQQLAYLVEHGYLSMPAIADDDIADKSKADNFARALAAVQIIWFTLQCVGRWIQGLGLSTLELSTIAFILCSLNMQFFWYRKPYDVRSPIILHTEHTISSILVNAGEAACRPYKRTPLDFIKPPPDDKSLVAPFWFGVDSVFHRPEDGGRRPIRCFGNNKTMPPAGISNNERIYGIFLEFLYFGLHFLGVFCPFPSTTERWLWVAANATLTLLLTIYMLAIYVGHKLQARFGLWMFQKETRSILELIEIMPGWLKFAIHAPFIGLYVAARAYTLVESFYGLRALPPRLYVCVEWSNFFPHL